MEEGKPEVSEIMALNEGKCIYRKISALLSFLCDAWTIGLPTQEQDLQFFHFSPAVLSKLEKTEHLQQNL